MTQTAGIADLVAADGVIAGLAVADKDALFEALGTLAAATTGIPASRIVERVREREALGATGFGQGTAIPHARIAGLAAVTAFAVRLGAPVDYGALDGVPVDLAVLLLSPEGAGADHLKALARISRTLRDPGTVGRLRGAPDAEAMRLVLAGEPARRAA